MPDLSNLKLVEENIEVADESTYVDAREFPPPLPPGVYQFIQGEPAFSATAGGYLQAEMTHEVAGGEHDKAKLAFDRVSNKPFERSGVKVSMMSDHLRALGDRTRYRSHQEYAEALTRATGKPFNAQVDWEVGCNHEDTDKHVEWGDDKVFRARGARNFPQANGKPTTEITCPVCGKKLEARSRITRRIPAQ
jgi:hypothetical protein